MLTDPAPIRIVHSKRLSLRSNGQAHLRPQPPGASEALRSRARRRSVASGAAGVGPSGGVGRGYPAPAREAAFSLAVFAPAALSSWIVLS